MVQEIQLDGHAELSRRLRYGTIGLLSLGYRFRFRNLAIRELPSKRCSVPLCRQGLKNPSHYEIQLHDVPEAHFATGSLYYLKRSVYPNIRDEEWFLFQLGAKGRTCGVRIDGRPFSSTTS
jgi:hypothetical protein